ncbi:MAG TPA: undecaprenyl-diphosphatase UppP [Bryobacteraceae bacterium]|nr:undecaprenyl-diphosphatase UppP [Bryobacteraceae bacterium]
MPIYQVIVLAIVQGLTEFLPISSTAHLYLTSWLLGWKTESLTFDIALHIGTLLAVLVYFARDWVQIIAHGFGLGWGRSLDLDRNRGLLWLLAIGSIPVGVAGLLFNKQAEGAWRNPMVIGGMMLGIGVVMGVAEWSGRKTRDIAGVNLVDAGTIGVAQALAVVPGVSRSGITITAGLFRNLNREAAARYSFLLSTPAIGAAAAKAVYDLIKHKAFDPNMETALAVGIAVSAITGMAVIAWFLRFLRHRSLWVFVLYRIIFGIIVLALAFFRRPAG